MIAADLSITGVLGNLDYILPTGRPLEAMNR
jgi:hypothetical protein